MCGNNIVIHFGNAEPVVQQMNWNRSKKPGKVSGWLSHKTDKAVAYLRPPL